MELVKNLYLQPVGRATTLVNEDEHIYRAQPAINGLVSQPIVPELPKNQLTLKHFWLKTVEKNADKCIFGYRPLIKIHTHEKQEENRTKKWSTYELDDYKWWTYKHAKQYSLSVATVLKKHGIKSGDCVFFFAKTSAEWMITSMACFQLGITISTGYDSMPADAIASIIDQTEPKAIFTETMLMEVVNKAYGLLTNKKQPSLVLYIGRDDDAPEALAKFKQDKPDDVTMQHIQDICHSNNDQQDEESPKPSDLALIMFTSGSTGTPKGVELTHENILAAIGGGQHLIMEWLLKDKHTYIGYLPLAHVLEFLVELVMISLAIPIGYGGVRTLMDDNVCGPNGQGKGIGDLRCLQPTILAGVPAIWEKIKAGIEKELDKQHFLIRSAFYGAVEAKWRLLCYFGKENSITRIFDKTIFAPINKVTGGKLIYGLSGGAPISYETHKFIASTLCFMVQGYGLTECCGLASLTYPALGPMMDSIGPPSPSIEFKLVDVPDTDYKAENGIGELWLRGPSLMRGYYKRPDLTKQAITSEGWFRTGDVATLNKEDGTIRITDRAKNLVKLSHGEYIALESLESKYRDCRAIKNICLIAHSHKSYIIAVVEPEQDQDATVLLKQLQDTARSAGMNKAETVQKVIPSHVDWIHHFMTTSGKIKRLDIEKEYKDQIDKLYI
ncbi:uncharacterized protein BX664DRAFT_342508 [Halteromyces radiatus]|uniref:uncharacterized protein n=1 Tax=Halteromyces radiatus TaxID=101107 RepID=UPI0022208433|nr:uncharacterized protein BX664DRAFT_342508 [Halteromyces radiatus]KAI8078701.1 hypothetical protein BX664DRAFT_342508 [Halteromyces radiatus]